MDGWEAGSQNWMPAFREELRWLRGHRPMTILTVTTGLVAEDYAGRLRFSSAWPYFRLNRWQEAKSVLPSSFSQTSA